MPRALILALLLAGPISAQVSRYELGRRMIRAEKAYDLADAEQRKACVKPFDDAVKAFFRLRFDLGADHLDDAARLLKGQPPFSAERAVAERFFPSSVRLIDLKAGTLAVTVRPTRSMPKGAFPGGLTVSARLGDGNPLSADLKGEAVEFKVPLVKSGTHLLRMTVSAGAREFVAWGYPVTVEGKLADRLAALKAARVKSPKTVEEATLADHVERLQELAAGEPSETDFPDELLAEAETLAKAIGEGKRFDAPTRAGQFWLTLPDPSARLRMRLPKSDGKVPLLICLHGAGGSENLFFDGYGDGCVPKEALRRGWAVAAPRLGFGGGPDLARLVDALGERYPAIDPKQVYLVGHSMGAAVAVSALAKHPQRFQGVALLGGGGFVPKDAKIAEVPVFVGCGKRDFALPMARKLVKDLRTAGVSKLGEKEYDDTERLLIVRAAVADVFRFFDPVKKAP